MQANGQKNHGDFSLRYNLDMRKFFPAILIASLFFFVFAGAGLNYAEQKAIDNSKLPKKVEESKGFQKWITNLKNKDFDVEADEFRLKEENEIYNTRWITINSIDEPGKEEEFEKNIAEKQLLEEQDEKIVFAPSNRLFIDYRYIVRDGYSPNEVHIYGLRDDKILNARVVDCSVRANCYFDRAYFINNSNDVFVVTEFSRNIDKKDEMTPQCLATELCSYTIKLHLIDLINNSRMVYESKPFDIILADTIPEL